MAKISFECKDEINESEALAILDKLSKEDKNVAKRIKEIRMELLKATDADSVSESIFSDLDSIDIFDVYETSGRTRYGYVEPCERAWEVFEETLNPYMEELKKLKRLKVASREYCKGVIKGLKKFKEESTTEYIELVEDAPDEFIKTFFEEWKKGGNKTEIKKMKAFIKEGNEENIQV